MFNVQIIKPKNLKEIWKIFPQLPEPVKYLAGGTDLVSAAHNRCGIPCRWIDISGLKEISGIKETNGKIFIGAGVKIAQIIDSALVKKYLPVLHSACGQFASPPLRNMATLGGNCASASPAGDGACALCAENAHAVVQLYGKKRRVPVENLFTGPKKNSLKYGEIITGFEIKKVPHSGSYVKLCPRKSFSIAKVSVAVSFYFRNGRIINPSITIGAAGPKVLRAVKTQDFLHNKRPENQAIEKAAEIIMTECAPITDFRSSREYRREMTGVLLMKALRRSIGESKE